MPKGIYPRKKKENFEYWKKRQISKEDKLKNEVIRRLLDEWWISLKLAFKEDKAGIIVNSNQKAYGRMIKIDEVLKYKGQLFYDDKHRLMYKRFCDICFRLYEGYGEFCCSRRCSSTLIARRRKERKILAYAESQERHN